MLSIEVENKFHKELQAEVEIAQYFTKINHVRQILSKLKEFRSIHKDPMMNYLARAMKSTQRSTSKLPCEQMVIVAQRLAHCPGFM